MRAFMILDPSWKAMGYNAFADSPVRLGKNNRCPSPKGFNIFLTLKDAAASVDRFLINSFVFIEVSTIGNVRNEFKNDPEKNPDDIAVEYYAVEIRAVRKIAPDEILSCVNDGRLNAGCGNEGDCNSGHLNRGSHNAGSHNLGDYNIGSHNLGGYNAGDYNMGSLNTGKCNIGDTNPGSHNIGDRNAGSFNSGSLNSGSFNHGSKNSGCGNVGCNNSGYYNKTDNSNGAFNTVEPEIWLFNKPSGWTFRKFKDSDAYKVLSEKLMLESLLPIPRAKVINYDDLTDEDKLDFPNCEIARCRIAEDDNSANVSKIQSRWDALSDIEKHVVMSLPNFDPQLFFDITGIDLTDEFIDR